MSLINQMLRDLERQQATGAHPQLHTPQGLQSVPVAPLIRLRRIAVALVMIVGTAGLVRIVAQNDDRDTAAQYQAGTGHFRVVQLPIPPRVAPKRKSGPTPQEFETLKQHTPESAGKTEPAQQAHAPAGVKHQDQDKAVPANPAGDIKVATTQQIQALAAVEIQLEDKTASANLAGEIKATTASVRSLDRQEQVAHLFDKSQRALASHQHALAENLLEQVLEMTPQHTNARLQLAGLMIAAQRTAAAEALLYEGMRFSPHDTDTVRAYAGLLARRNALQPALDALNTVTADEHDADGETLALKAEILNRLHQYPQAVRLYREALLRQPEQAVWWTGLGVALEQDGQEGAALNAYRNAAQWPLPEALGTYVERRIQALSAPALSSNG